MNLIDRQSIETAVSNAFKHLSFSPREGQYEVCVDILSSFLLEGYNYIVLNSPTGSGKSVIGAVVSFALEALEHVKIRDDYNGLASIALMHQNILVNQYRNTFEGTDYKVILGAENYACNVLERMKLADHPATADHCIRKILAKTQKMELLNICNHDCRYMETRKWLSNSSHIVTNYTYFFTLRSFRSWMMPKRYVSILDEAHMMNDVYVNFSTISTNPIQLKTLLKEISPYTKLNPVKVKIDSILTRLQHLPMTSDNEVDSVSCESLVTELQLVYREVSEFFAELSEDYESEETLKEFTELSKLSKKYADKLGRIDNLRSFEYRPSYSYNSESSELEIKPLFMEKMFKTMFGISEKVLLMSATISDLLISKTCSIPPEEIKMITMDSKFPKENKEIVFFNPQSINYRTLQDKVFVQSLCNSVKDIVSLHAVTNQERGIILVPSFKLCNLVSDSLKGFSDSGELEIFEHVQGTKVSHLLDAFKSYSGKPAILISPSFFEGVDLPDDLSRFQIIVKVPFASLGDARIRMILKEYPEIYNLMATMKIVQGCGRSVRSISDKAVSYVLDKNIVRLWFHPSNVWRNQFSLTEV